MFGIAWFFLAQLMAARRTAQHSIASQWEAMDKTHHNRTSMLLSIISNVQGYEIRAVAGSFLFVVLISILKFSGAAVPYRSGLVQIENQHLKKTVRFLLL